MQRIIRPLGLFVLAAVVCLAADPVLPAQLEGIGIDERLGRQVDLGLEFTAENGYPVALGDFFKKDKPVLLNLVYYSCPMLCNLVLNGQVNVLREIPWTPGEEFEVVTVSINPNETFDLAKRKKAAYLESYGKPVTGWHFLTDYKGNVKKLADQAGFRYRYDDKQGQFIHSAAIMFLTPDGRMSRYLYGIKFKSRDVRLALTEASEGKLGVTMDKLLLYCFHYDPMARSYVPFARNIMRGGGVLSVLLIGTVLFRLFRAERKEGFLPPGPTDDLVTAK